MAIIENHKHTEIDFDSLGDGDALLLKQNEFHLIRQAEVWSKLNGKKTMYVHHSDGTISILFSSPKQDAGKAKKLVLRTVKKLAKDRGITMAGIQGSSYVRGKYSKQVIAEAVNLLVEEGDIERRETKDGRSGDPLDRYFPIAKPFAWA